VSEEQTPPAGAARPGAAPAFVVHRLTSGRLVAWVFIIGAVFVFVDTARRKTVGTSGGVLLASVAVCLVAYVLGLRPAVAEGPDGVEVRNPLRTTRVPWGSIADADVTDVLRLHADGQVVRCFAVPRRRPPVARRGPAPQTYGFMLPASEPSRTVLRPGIPRASAIAERLLELARRFQASSNGPLVVRLAPDAVVALALAAVLAGVAAAIALL
jgi:hypothetical protein